MGIDLDIVHIPDHHLNLVRILRRGAMNHRTAAADEASGHRPCRPSGPGRDLPRDAGEHLAWAQDAPWLRPPHQGRRSGPPRRPSPARNITWGIFPPHLGMRQYWRDFDSLERWARTGPHAQWWHGFIKDRGGTGFWHETYLARGGVEAGYLDMPNNLGLSQFAPTLPSGLDVLSPAAVGHSRPGDQGKPASRSGLRHLSHQS